ncbi:hypothetical protein AWB85_13060 [Mycobacteroides immunogenum]|uniref:AAA+ ATPase domain-containing protein n=1 Tax=Mycobacteroides immunogenum TaxID=83262 RepID=A0A179V5C4_9MYCO|nr:hypothetical protein AWB85_13060 [Mycobacteroides immunogenum]
MGFQDLVFAWAATALLAEEPPLISLGVAGTVVQVGAQTGFHVDDVAVLTDLGNAVFFQAKIKLALESAEDSPLADALEQAVIQLLDGCVPQVGAPGRQVDPARDAIILCTDASAPATVRKDLANAIERTASQPAGTALGFEMTKPQNAALHVALEHVRRAWKTAKRPTPSDEDLRSFFKALKVLTLDLKDGRNDHQAALTALHRAIPDGSCVSTAWKTLYIEGHEASEARQWRDRPALSVALSREGITLAEPKSHAVDIKVIRERSATNLVRMQAEARLPVSGTSVFISRSVSEQLCAETTRDNVLIIGDAGSGKSAVAQELATLRSPTEEVVVLLARDLAGSNQLRTKAPVQEVVRAWSGPAGLLVIDGVDALRGSDDREALSSIVSALVGTRWQVIATARTFDTRYSRPLRRSFPGSPLSHNAGMFDARLMDVCHLLVGDLTDDELTHAVRPPMNLAEVVAEASSDLRKLLLNPFNLRLAAELANGPASGQQAELLQVRSRVQLLNYYWDWRIRNCSRAAREALLKRLSAEMVKRRSLQVAEEEPTVIGTDSSALEDLLSQSVLTALDGPIPGVGRVLAFAHNILFDYAAAIYVLYHPTDSANLTSQLDADPTLPLVARPSFDLLVDMLWDHRSSGQFWPGALQVAESQHDLASLAIASRIANLVRNPDDLLELTPKSGEANTDTTLLPRQRLTNQLIGAVRAEVVVPDVSSAALPLAVLAQNLASNASDSYSDAALAIDLLEALQRRIPISDAGPSNPGDGERANAIAVLLDGSRSDPRKMENIAGAVARQLKYVMRVSPEVRQALQRLVNDQSALKQWGGTVLTWFPDTAAAVLNEEPQLARTLAAVAVTFKEVRDEQVSLSGSAIVGMNESRKQQAGRAAYQLGEIFSDLCEKNIVTSAEIICDLLSGEDEPADAHKWPIAAHGKVGYIEDGYGLSLRPRTNQDEHKMLAALSKALLTVSTEDADSAVSILVDRMHSAFGWAALLDQPSDATALGRILFAALESGALLAHPDTFPHAATLLAALVHDGGGLSVRIEGAVRNAIALADTNGASDHLKNVLVGCLKDTDINDAELVRRRENLGDSVPDIPPPLSVYGESTAWSMVDDFQRYGVKLAQEVEKAARELDSALAEVQNGGKAATEAVDRLLAAFIHASEAFANAETHPWLELLLVRAAARLAYVVAILPDSPEGNQVLQVLRDAADQADAGSFIR